MRKKNLIFILEFILCFLEAYKGMVFSPSFTMIFAVIGMGFCMVAEILHMFQKKSTKICSRVLFIIGMIWVFPAVIIYATGDDWMNGCMKAAGIGSIVLCVIWSGWMWKRRGIRLVEWGKAVELLISLSAALLAVFCGINSVALIPYGVGLLLMTFARLFETKEYVFLVGVVLMAVFPAAPMLGGVF